MSKHNAKLFGILDTLMSEYGWTLEYCLKLPGDVVISLYKAIQLRKGREARVWTKFIGAACAAGFGGKLDKLDKLFDDEETETDTEVDTAAWKGQVKGLWLRMQTKGKTPTTEDYKRLNEEFEIKWKNGENIEL